MINPDLVHAGERLYDVHRVPRTKIGNTTMSRQGCWPVDVLGVVFRDGQKLAFYVVWNALNPMEIYGRDDIARLRRSRPKGDT